jgi:hypothetical protein
MLTADIAMHVEFLIRLIQHKNLALKFVWIFGSQRKNIAINIDEKDDIEF